MTEQGPSRQSIVDQDAFQMDFEPVRRSLNRRSSILRIGDLPIDRRGSRRVSWAETFQFKELRSDGTTVVTSQELNKYGPEPLNVLCGENNENIIHEKENKNSNINVISNENLNLKNMKRKFSSDRFNKVIAKYYNPEDVKDSETIVNTALNKFGDDDVDKLMNLLNKDTVKEGAQLNKFFKHFKTADEETNKDRNSNFSEKSLIFSTNDASMIDVHSSTGICREEPTIQEYWKQFQTSSDSFPLEKSNIFDDKVPNSDVNSIHETTVMSISDESDQNGVSNNFVSNAKGLLDQFKDSVNEDSFDINFSDEIEIDANDKVNATLQNEFSILNSQECKDISKAIPFKCDVDMDISQDNFTATSLFGDIVKELKNDSHVKMDDISLLNSPKINTNIGKPFSSTLLIDQNTDQMDISMTNEITLDSQKENDFVKKAENVCEITNNSQKENYSGIEFSIFNSKKSVENNLKPFSSTMLNDGNLERIEISLLKTIDFTQEKIYNENQIVDQPVLNQKENSCNLNEESLLKTAIYSVEENNSNIDENKQSELDFTITNSEKNNKNVKHFSSTMLNEDNNNQMDISLSNTINFTDCITINSEKSNRIEIPASLKNVDGSQNKNNFIQKESLLKSTLNLTNAIEESISDINENNPEGIEFSVFNTPKNEDKIGKPLSSTMLKDDNLNQLDISLSKTINITKDITISTQEVSQHANESILLKIEGSQKENQVLKEESMLKSTMNLTDMVKESVSEIQHKNNVEIEFSIMNTQKKVDNIGKPFSSTMLNDENLDQMDISLSKTINFTKDITIGAYEVNQNPDLISKSTMNLTNVIEENVSEVKHKNNDEIGFSTIDSQKKEEKIGKPFSSTMLNDENLYQMDISLSKTINFTKDITIGAHEVNQHANASNLENSQKENLDLISKSAMNLTNVIEENVSEIKNKNKDEIVFSTSNSQKMEEKIGKPFSSTMLNDEHLDQMDISLSKTINFTKDITIGTQEVSQHANESILGNCQKENSERIVDASVLKSTMNLTNVIDDNVSEIIRKNHDAMEFSVLNTQQNIYNEVNPISANTLKNEDTNLKCFQSIEDASSVSEMTNMGHSYISDVDQNSVKVEVFEITNHCVDNENLSHTEYIPTRPFLGKSASSIIDEEMKLAENTSVSIEKSSEVEHAFEQINNPVEASVLESTHNVEHSVEQPIEKPSLKRQLSNISDIKSKKANQTLKETKKVIDGFTVASINSELANLQTAPVRNNYNLISLPQIGSIHPSHNTMRIDRTKRNSTFNVTISQPKQIELDFNTSNEKILNVGGHNRPTTSINFVRRSLGLSFKEKLIQKCKELDSQRDLVDGKKTEPSQTNSIKLNESSLKEAELKSNILTESVTVIRVPAEEKAKQNQCPIKNASIIESEKDCNTKTLNVSVRKEKVDAHNLSTNGDVSLEISVIDNLNLLQPVNFMDNTSDNVSDDMQDLSDYLNQVYSEREPNEKSLNISVQKLPRVDDEGEHGADTSILDCTILRDDHFNNTDFVNLENSLYQKLTSRVDDFCSATKEDNMYKVINKLEYTNMKIRIQTMEPDVFVTRFLWSTLELRIRFGSVINPIIEPDNDIEVREIIALDLISLLNSQKKLPLELMNGVVDPPIFDGECMNLKFREEHRSFLHLAQQYVLTHFEEKQSFFLKNFRDSSKILDLIKEFNLIVTCARNLALELRKIHSKELMQILPRDNEDRYRISVDILALRGTLQLVFAFNPFMYPDEVIHPTIIPPEKDKDLYPLNEFSAALLMIKPCNFNYITNLIKGADYFILALRKVLIQTKRNRKQCQDIKAARLSFPS